MRTQYLASFLLILWTLAASMPAEAATLCASKSVNFNLVSLHQKPGRLQEFNPGIGLECAIPPLLDGRLIVWKGAGVFENSFGRTSIYVTTGADLALPARALPGARVGAFATALTGYEILGYEFIRPAGGLRLVLPIASKVSAVVLLFPPYGSINPLIAHLGISIPIAF